MVDARPPYWKSKTAISLQWFDRPITAKFGMVTQFDLIHLGLYGPLKFRAFWNRTWRTAAILKIEKSRYLGNGTTDRHEVWHAGAIWPSTPWHSVSTPAVSAKTGDILFNLHPWHSLTGLRAWCFVFIFQKIAVCSCMEWQDSLFKTGNRTADIKVRNCSL